MYIICTFPGITSLMCQIDIFMHVQYLYFIAHHSNKADKTVVLLSASAVFVYVYRVDTIIVVHCIIIKVKGVFRGGGDVSVRTPPPHRPYFMVRFG
jgi:hypothetical protein